jgi:hypothetical protein
VSSLLFRTDENEVLVATDTLAVFPDGRPFKYTTKAYSIPHLRMIIAATGSLGVLGRWLIQINDWLPVKGIDDLNNQAPGYLAHIWTGLKEELSIKDGATTVYHFGFSEQTDVIHLFAYRSVHAFQSEALSYGVGTKPQSVVPEDANYPEVFRTIMDNQRAAENSKPKEQRVYIGGEIQIHHLSRVGCAIYTLDRFEDYDRDEKAMYENFKERS